MIVVYKAVESRLDAVWYRLGKCMQARYDHSISQNQLDTESVEFFEEWVGRLERKMKMKKKYEPLYWAHEGKFQERYEELRYTLVPDSGDAATPYGQLLRYAINIYYDIYNNGGCNLDMRSFQEAGFFLVSFYTKLQPIAQELGVENFVKKLRCFTENLATDQANDEVIDVIVTYVDREHSKTK
jgi:hypothetical protein